MPTKAQLVREALTAEIAKVAGIGATGSDYRNARQETNLPAAYTVLDDDESKRGPTRSKEVTAHFIIALIFRTDTPWDYFDDLRGAIETQIEDDPSLGGLAMDAWVTGCGRLKSAKTTAGDCYTRDVLVDVLYRHDRGAP